MNGLTHLAGGLLACVGLLVLLASAGRTDQIVAFGIFALSLVALYSASALYHLLPLSPAGIARLRRVDHMMIFVLIAGTYTPFCLLALEGAWRVGLLGVIWSLARALAQNPLCDQATGPCALRATLALRMDAGTRQSTMRPWVT